MPEGRTTYPTLGEAIRSRAEHLDVRFFPDSHHDLLRLATMADELGVELARTRRELADMDALAAARLQVCDSQAAMIATVTEQRDNANRRYLERDREAGHWSQTHGELSAAYNRIADAAAVLVAYAEAQPCMCSEHEVRANVADPCDRCKALGRVLDEPVDL
jgi:hypothetical protein